jgi:hypothetical protein
MRLASALACALHLSQRPGTGYRVTMLIGNGDGLTALGCGATPSHPRFRKARFSRVEISPIFLDLDKLTGRY